MKISYLSSLVRKVKDLGNLKQIHGQALTLGLVQNNQSLACKIFKTYSKLKCHGEAQKVFDWIRDPDIVSYTSLLYLYLHNQLPSKVLSIFSQLIHTGLRPDSHSVVGVLSACGSKKDKITARMVHGMVFKFQLIDSNPIVGNALIDMYSKNGEIALAWLVFKTMEMKDVASWNSLLNGLFLCDDSESAYKVFDQMPERNSVSWTVMISGCVRCKKAVRGLKLYRAMKAQGKNHQYPIPTPAAMIVVVLSGCAHVGALQFGQSIHGYINKCCFSCNVTVNNALMDMYSKNGSFDLAISLFSEVVNKDVFTWTTVISACAIHGKGRQALDVYSDMIESGVVPNEVTFLSLLSACSHAGLVLEGQRIFHRMIYLYGLKPKIDHYGCMVDLFCRAGLIKEAKEFMERMPMKADGVIWRSLLNACWVGGYFDSVEMIIKEKLVIELEGDDDDDAYSILSNIYFAADRQDCALKMRVKKRRGAARCGCSWVEVNGFVHEFLAGRRRVHHCLTGLTQLLESITGQLN